MDIPLPESEIHTLKFTGNFSLTYINVGDVNFTYKSSTSVDTISYTEKSVDRTGFAKGVGNTIVENIAEYSLNIIISTVIRTTFNMSNNPSVNVSNKTFSIPIENGNYRMPVDCLGISAGLCGNRKYSFLNDIADSEYIYFTVNNNIATITTTTITLRGSAFKCTATGSFNRIYIIADRIEKVN